MSLNSNWFNKTKGTLVHERGLALASALLVRPLTKEALSQSTFSTSLKGLGGLLFSLLKSLQLFS